MSDHCISAFLQRQDEKSYKAYVTDALKAIAENTSRSAGGTVMVKRFVDVIDRSKPQEDRSAEEIIDHVKNALSMLG